MLNLIKIKNYLFICLFLFPLTVFSQKKRDLVIVGTRKQILASIDTNNHEQMLIMSLYYLYEKYGIDKTNTLVIKHMVIEVNAIRRNNGLEAYRVSPILGKTAQCYSQYMLDNDHYSHTDKEGRSAQGRAEMHGWHGGWVGENIHGLSPSISPILDSWMASPGHKAAILSKEFKFIGGGVYGSERNKKGIFSPDCYWVLNFANTKE